MGPQGAGGGSRKPYDPGGPPEPVDDERVHVRQYERWGPFFLPAYFACSLAALARGRDAYRANPFEKEAFEKS